MYRQQIQSTPIISIGASSIFVSDNGPHKEYEEQSAVDRLHHYTN